jgi:uncharacterized protein YndB with AHSA1/START domain
MAKLTVERSIWVAVPRERVWLAITEPAQLERWFAPGCPWAIPALQVGATATFYNTATEPLLATIEVVDPPRQFTLRWQPEASYPATTLVTTFLLEAENEGTRVTITEAGYETLPEEIRRQRFDETTEGYSMSMENLKAYLEAYINDE